MGIDTTERRKKMGPKAWRDNGRVHPPAVPVEPLPELGSLGDAEMSAMALQALVDVIRRPSRRAQSKVGAAKALLEYTKAKPATKLETTGANGGPILSEFHVRLVAAEDGKPKE